MLGRRVFTCRRGDAATDPGRRENTLESCEIEFGTRVFTCRRPSEAPIDKQDARGCPRMAPRRPHEARGCPRMAPRYVCLRGFLAGVQNHTCFYVSAVVSRRLTAPGYVCLRVFLESGRGPKRPAEAPEWPPYTCFYVFFLRVAEPPFSSYVFLRVGGRFTPS